MTHFLRTSDNKTVVDMEVSIGDISVLVDIEHFGPLLLNCSNPSLMIRDFSGLQELRGEFLERNLRGETPMQFVGRRPREVGDRWGLSHITD